MEKLEDRIIKIIRNHAFWFPEVISNESRLIEDIGIDSLDALELIMEFERDFDIVIDECVAFDCKTVEDVVDMITTYHKVG